MGIRFRVAGLLALGTLLVVLLDGSVVFAAPSGHGGGGSAGGGHGGFSSGSFSSSGFSGRSAYGYSRSYPHAGTGNPAGHASNVTGLHYGNHPGWNGHDSWGYHHGGWWWHHWYPYYCPIICLPLWFYGWDDFYPCYADYWCSADWGGYAYPEYYGYGSAYAVPNATATPAGQESTVAYDPAACPVRRPPPPAPAVQVGPDGQEGPDAADSDAPETEMAAGRRYYSEAVSAFERKDYRESARLANHAAVEMPRDAKVHLLFSLSLFALKEYRGAAMEAHVAAVLGPVIDWKSLYPYYNDLPTYTKQLDALGEFVRKNPSSLDAKFLLAYHDLMLGHGREAKELLAEIVSKAPKDNVAVQLLKSTEGTAAKTAPAAKPKP